MTQKIKFELKDLNDNTKSIQLSKDLYKKDLVSNFRELFTGREDCWGKVEGECVRENLGDSHYEKHLQGEESLEIYPISDDGTCNFAVVDFDFKKDENRAK